MSPKNTSERVHVLRALRRWQAASQAYQRDCNARFLGPGKTDTRRERLSKRARRLFDLFLAQVDGQSSSKEDAR